MTKSLQPVNYISIFNNIYGIERHIYRNRTIATYYLTVNLILINLYPIKRTIFYNNDV